MSEHERNWDGRFDRRRGMGLDRAILDEALHNVDVISRNVPISTTLRELQLVVERMTFSKLHERDVQNDAATLAEIDLFFRDEVSIGMLQFVHWMAQRNLLTAIAGDQGLIFLSQCMAKYRRVQEVQVTTAIDITREHKEQITSRLRAIHPQPARILFNTQPTMIAGILINTGAALIDKSLRTHVTHTVSRTGKFQGLSADE